MTDMTEFTTMTIEPVSETNLAVTNYTVSFSTPVPVLNDDILYITFPTEADLPTTVECEASTGITTITCTNTGQDLTVEFTSISDADGIGDFAFLVLDVTNPGTTQPSSAFSGIYMEDEDGADAAQYTTELTVTMDTPATLTDYSLT